MAREYVHTSLTRETSLDPRRYVLRKYHMILDEVRRTFNKAVDDIKQRMPIPSAPMVTTLPYIHNVEASLLGFTNTIVHALNTFIATVTQSRIEPMWNEANVRAIVTGDLHFFVAARLTEELSATLSSTDYISNKVFLYPSISRTSEPVMLSISISDDVRLNGNGHVILLINEDENQYPSKFLVRERRGWDGSAEQQHQVWNTVVSILDEI